MLRKLSCPLPLHPSSSLSFKALEGPPTSAASHISHALFSVDVKGPDVARQMFRWETRKNLHQFQSNGSGALAGVKAPLDSPREGVWVGGTDRGNLQNCNLDASLLSAHTQV